MKDWRAYAQHILDCVEKLRRIAERGDIAKDDILYDAALRNLQTLAEATQRLPDELKARFPAIAWSKIGAFRNVIVHNYLGDIDPATIGNVIAEHIEPLAVVVEEMFADQGSGRGIA